MLDINYNECLSQAAKTKLRNGVGEGAVLYVFYEKLGLKVFKNRSRPTRDFVKDGGFGHSGFQEHAEQAVINDALAMAVANKDRIVGAVMFLGGFSDGRPYYYIDKTYICMNCAKYMMDTLPLFNTHVYLPAESGWFVTSAFELYRLASDAHTMVPKPGNYRKDRMKNRDDTTYTSEK